MTISKINIPGPWPERFYGGISHPQLYLWDAWSYIENDIVHLYCLAVNRRENDGSTIDPFLRNSYQFHIRHFISPDSGKTWKDCGIFHQPGKDSDGHSARNIWSGSVLRLPDSRILATYTGIRERGDDYPFLQNLAYGISKDGYGIEPNTPRVLSCPMQDNEELRALGYFFNEVDELGAAAGECEGPILAWRDPYCFMDRLSSGTSRELRLKMVWAAKASAENPAIGLGELCKNGDGFKLNSIRPPIRLPDEHLFSQIECPKVIIDRKSGRYLLIVATTSRISEQQRYNVDKTTRLYYSNSLDGPWISAGNRTSEIGGMNGLFALEVLRANHDDNTVLCIAPYTEMAGQNKSLTFPPAFWLDLNHVGKVDRLSVERMVREDNVTPILE